MKNTLLALLGFILLSTPLVVTAQWPRQYGEFIYTEVRDGELLLATIIGYTGEGGAVAIPDAVDDGPVIAIGDGAFIYSRLTSVTIPGSVRTIGGGAFQNCTSLGGVFFKGNAPRFDSSVFMGANNVTVYYLPGTTGWGATFANRSTRLWNPLMQTSGPGFGVGQGGFGFNITGTADIPIVVEGCTNLANAEWVPLQSLSLTNGAVYFSDPDWTNYPDRIYRIRSP